LIAAVLVVLAYAIAEPILNEVQVPFGGINLPLGLAATFLGAFTSAVRREPVQAPQGQFGHCRSLMLP
jgi:hypothetical protein